MSVPIEASGVATRDVTGSVSRRTVAERVGRGTRFRRPGCIAGDAQISGRISKMFVTPIQGLSLSVVRGAVPLEESALEIEKMFFKCKTTYKILIQESG